MYSIPYGKSGHYDNLPQGFYIQLANYFSQTGESINQKDALKEPYRKKILSKTTQ
jgi:hypothetical protein